MSSIITSLKDLVTSVFEVIFSVFNGAIDMVSGLIMGLVNSVIGIVKMALHTVGNFLEAAGGVGKFVASKPSHSLFWLDIPSTDTECEKAILLLSHSLRVECTVTCSINVAEAVPSKWEIRS